ncbi:MAG: hypothetical protein EKK48_10125 [Candidatus Melainabacteria bacterium]|nr:MAG: hypothetical protein EKK48_10125 [Candidatus Melainabacteria bacterium]
MHWTSGIIYSVLRTVISRFAIIFVSGIAACTCLLIGVTAAEAQVFTVADIGYTPTPGTFALNTGVTPPTYSTGGSGSGIADKLTFARTTSSGNTEIRGRITSQSSATSGAYTGLMIRESDISQSCAMASVGVTVSGTVSFQYRPTINASVTTVTGPTVTLPVYVRLAKNGDTISAYYSQSDPQNMTLLGSYTQTNAMPNLYYTGFTSYSTTSALNTGVMDYVSLMTSVPQQSSNLKLWLRGDLGITSSAGAISSWADSSSFGHNATQTTAGLKPTLVTGVLNNGVQPAVNFSGSQYLNLAANYADLNNGASIFVVVKPSSTSATGTPVSFSNTSNADAIFAQTVGTQGSLSSFAGTTGSTVTTTTNPLSTSQYKLLEETLVPGVTAGTAVGTIFVNGSQIVQSTTMQNLANTTRNTCNIGAGVGATNIFSGSIAEILVYNNVSNAQRGMVEAYILSKYGVGVAPTLDTPTLSITNAVVAPGQTVTATQDQNATVFFTTSGGTVPNSTSQWFGTNPIVLNNIQTVKAVAIAPNFNNSPVLTSTFTVDPTTAGVPRNGLSLWLRSDQGVVGSGSVSEWDDCSGSGNNATQTVSGNRPTFSTNSVNGLPAITFGASQFFALPAGFSDFTAGASIFAILKPTSVTAGARILDLGNGATANNLQLQEPSTNGAALYTYNGSSPLSVTASSALTLNQFQLLEAVHNGAASGTIYTNSMQQAQGSLNNLLNVTRSNNFLGQGSGGGNNYIGQIAELMLFNRGVTAAERAAIEAYLINRNQVLNANSAPAPVFSIGTSTLTAPATVAIEGPSDSIFFITQDGSTPTTSSPVYSGPVLIKFTQTLKAIAVNKGVQSAVTSATYTLDSTNYPAPGATSTPLQLDLQLPNQSIPQDNNQR